MLIIMKSDRPKIVQMAYQLLRANVNCMQHAEQKNAFNFFISAHLPSHLIVCIYRYDIFHSPFLFSTALFFITKFTPFLAHFTLSYFLQESSSFSSFRFFFAASHRSKLTQPPPTPTVLSQRFVQYSRSVRRFRSFVCSVACEKCQFGDVEEEDARRGGKKMELKFMERFFEFCE